MYCKKCGMILAIGVKRPCIRCRNGGFDNITPLTIRHENYFNWETEAGKKGYRNCLGNPSYDKTQIFKQI